MEILWPDQRPAAPDQNVATLVSRLRAVLGAELIQGGRAGYRLAACPGIVVDLDAAARLCDQAEGKLLTAAAVALAAAERAHEPLSAGTAIGDEPYADWADPARERVRGLLRRVRLAAAEAALATGDPRLAAGYAEAAMAADPFDEAAHRWYMSASVAAGEQAKALRLTRRSGGGSATTSAPTWRRRRGSCTWRSCASRATAWRAGWPQYRLPRPVGGLHQAGRTSREGRNKPA